MLVVDDELELNNAIQARLLASGFDVASANDGSTGLEAVRQSLPDAILLDIRMPGINGAELLMLMTAEGINVPVIVMAGFPDFDEEEIGKTIHYLIDKKYLNDEEFGKAFVKEKVKNKKIGPRALKSEIYPHQLSPELIDTLITKIYQEFDLIDLIKFHLVKRRIEKNLQLSHKDKNTLTNFLTRKGFYWDTIQGVYHDWGLI